MKKHLSLIAFAFFISTTLLFDPVFAAVSEGCEIFEIKAGCDLSGWLKLIFGVSIGTFLAILLYTLSRRSNLKLERNHEQLKENTKQLQEKKIVIMTASTVDEEELKNMVDLGVDSVLQKPVDIDALLNKIEEIGSS